MTVQVTGSHELRTGHKGGHFGIATITLSISPASDMLAAPKVVIPANVRQNYTPFVNKLIDQGIEIGLALWKQANRPDIANLQISDLTLDIDAMHSSEEDIQAIVAVALFKALLNGSSPVEEQAEVLLRLEIEVDYGHTHIYLRP